MSARAPRRGHPGPAVLLLALLAGGPATRSAAAAEPPPSILLLTIDTLRPDHLGFYGASRKTSPFLDSLAAGALVFENAYSTSSWTVPAVASLVTGVYPTSHGVVHGAVTRGVLSLQEVLPASLPTLPEQLKKMGYRTFGVTANHHMKEDLGFARGFDRYECLGFADGDQVNAAILRWKSEITASREPVFIWLHYFDPHRNYFARPPWINDFLPDASAQELERAVTLQEKWEQMNREVRRDPRLLEVARALYDSEIRYFDDQLRALYAALPLGGMLTMITADHGEEFLEHGDFGHSHNLYNPTMRIPMLIRPPDGGPARIEKEPVSLVDCAPTLLEAAGGSPPRHWKGVSLWSRDGGARVPARPFIVAELDRTAGDSGIKALVAGKWKLITRAGTASMELYDLETDRGETSDLGSREKSRAQKLRQDLMSFLRSLPRPPGNAATRPLDRDVEEKLRRLGYMN